MFRTPSSDIGLPSYLSSSTPLHNTKDSGLIGDSQEVNRHPNQRKRHLQQEEEGRPIAYTTLQPLHDLEAVEIGEGKHS